jgi:hypothetical protein
MYKVGNSVEQVFGGSVIKQGDQTPFGFMFRDENGEVVSLTNATVKIKVANEKALVLEKDAIITNEYTATFSIGQEDITGSGDMRLEFIVTYSDGVKEKFPSDDWQHIKITPTLEDIDKTAIAYLTFEKMKADFTQKVDDLNKRVDNIVAENGNSNLEIVDARGDATSLKQRLDNEQAKIDEVYKKVYGSVSIHEFENEISTTDKTMISDPQNWNWSPALKKAASEAKGRVLEFKNMIYSFDDTIDFPTIQRWSGVGSKGSDTEKTTIKRRTNNIGFRAVGNSVKSGGGHLGVSNFENILFKGGDKSADLFQFFCAEFNFRECKISGVFGRALYAKESFDSRLTNTDMEWVGSSDGTLAGIELYGGDADFEFTNQIHFIGCRFETFLGTMLSISGNNTNEIFFTNVKFESFISKQKPIVIKKANAIHFDGVNIFTHGQDGTKTIPCQIEINNCKGVFGTFFLEHGGVPGSTSCNLQKFVDIIGSANIKLYTYIYSNEKNILGSYCVEVDSTSADSTINIDGELLDAGTKVLTNKPNTNKSVVIKSKKEPYTRYVSDEVPNDSWYLGRIVPDGTKTRFKLIHQDNALGEIEVFNVDQNSNINIRKQIFLSDGFYPAQLSSPPTYSRDGATYTDSSNNLKTTRTFLNGAYRRIGYSSTAPADGSWNSGDIVFNSFPSVKGENGSQYVLHGWRRITTGSNNALNTDWVEMRMSTGT